jgi:hypothetical protein
LVGSTDSLRFVPAANWNGTVPGLSVHLIDVSGGAVASGTHIDLTVAGTGGATPYSAGTIALSGSVTAVNDAPVATGTTAALPALFEDNVNPVGTPVSTLFTNLFSDNADLGRDGSSANALAGVAVVSNAASSEGVWQYWNGSAWANVGFVSTAAALVVKSTDSLRFVPAVNWNGTVPALAVHLIDDSSGAVVSGTQIDLTSTGLGGTTPYGADAIALSGSVVPVNDAPVATGTTASLPATLEDDTTSAGATVAALFTDLFSDNADGVTGGSMAGALAGVAVVGNLAGSEGVWQYWNGSAWTNMGAVSTGAALVVKAADSLRFVPAANWNGAVPALTVHLIDDSQGAVVSGTHVDLTAFGTGGATPYSVGSIALNGSVTAVNDAPVLNDKDHSFTIPFGISGAPVGQVGFAVGSLVGLHGSGPDNVSDVDDGAETGIALTGMNQTYGSWWFSTDGGANWSRVNTVGSTDALLLRTTDRLYFQLEKSMPETLSGAMTFHSWDQTWGTAGEKVAIDATGGSSAFSAATDTLTLKYNTLLPNGSFDDGLAGWTITSNVTVGGADRQAVVDAASGQSVVTLDAFLGLATGTINALAGGGATTGNAITPATSHYVAENSTLTFDWAFRSSDSEPYRDFSFVAVNGEAFMLFQAVSPGDVSGTYSAVVRGGTWLSVGVGASDYSDSSVSPVLRVDNFKLTTAVPQTAAMSVARVAEPEPASDFTAMLASAIDVDQPNPATGSNEPAVISDPMVWSDPDQSDFTHVDAGLTQPSDIHSPLAQHL